LWIVLSGVLFGSQFVPSKYCPKFRPGPYNISMALGILAGSILTVLALGTSGTVPGLFILCFIGGMTWVLGNYLLIRAVAMAGMARAFVIVNFSAVLSFIGGAMFLGELGGVTLPGLAMILAAVTMVILGSFLVTTTVPKGGDHSPSTAGNAVRRGLAAALAATVFFSAYNVMIAHALNRAGMTAPAAFMSIAPGIVVGAVLVAILAGDGGLADWKAAQARWHILAATQGIIWAAAMVCIMFGWMGTGISVGTPVQVGTQTLASSLWGIAFFGEFRGLEKKTAAYARLAAGAVVTVAGILVMTFV